MGENWYQFSFIFQVFLGCQSCPGPLTDSECKILTHPPVAHSLFGTDLSKNRFGERTQWCRPTHFSDFLFWLEIWSRGPACWELLSFWTYSTDSSRGPVHGVPWTVGLNRWVLVLQPTHTQPSSLRVLESPPELWIFVLTCMVCMCVGRGGSEGCGEPQRLGLELRLLSVLAII